MKFILLSLLVLTFCLDLNGAIGDSTIEWTLVSKEEGVTLFRAATENSSLYIYRGEAEVPYPMEKVLTVIKDTKRRKEWVRYVVDSYVVKKPTPHERIQYIHSSPPWPIADRDILLHTKDYYNPNTNEYIIETLSTQERSVPEHSDRIRMSVLRGVMRIKAESSGSTLIRAEIQVDPKGLIPSWIVNMVQKTWPKTTLARFRSQLEKPDIIINPHFKLLVTDKLSKEQRPPLPDLEKYQ